MMTLKNIKTTCPYCGVGCGVVAEVESQTQAEQPVDIESNKFQVTTVSGDKNHPANLGKLCVKGSSLHETLGNRGRLLSPKINGQDQDWETALDHVANGLNKVIEQHGPHAVAFYLSGQLLTEDYYVANKLAKGFIKTPHVDTNSRLCMSSAVAAYKQTLGADAVPCDYTDLEKADLLVLVGSNAAWTHPILYQRMVSAKKANPNLRVVVIDPRATATTDLADLHLAIAPDSDVWLFNGLLHYLQQQECVDWKFVEQSTNGLTSALEAVKDCDLATVSQHTDIAESQLKTFYQWFVDTEKAVTFYSQGVNQSSVGTDKNCSIINCHLLTGRIGKEGAGPFSITGQPNAMGGREVGGLANMLAAHMNYSPAEKECVARFWQVDQVCDGPGYKAVDLFDAVDRGEIKAIWIMATNPVVSMPEADKVARALKKCDLVVVSECFDQTDTGQLADVLLPATGWGEKDGTVTNSERRISRQRPLLPAQGEARHDWLIMSQVAQRMGFSESFNYQSPHQVFVEHAQLSDFENHGQRAFDIGAMADLNASEYEQLIPVQWPQTKAAAKISNKNSDRLFADQKFFTADGKAQFKTIVLTDITEPSDSAISTEVSHQTPNDIRYVLNSGRLRDQWHTMTRTGRAKRLLEHQDTPYLSLNAESAAQHQITNGDLVQVQAIRQSPENDFSQTVVATAKIDAGVGHKQVFMPIHWTDQFSSNSRVSKAIGDATDPQSGQPAFKQAQVTIKKLSVTYAAYWLLRDDQQMAKGYDNRAEALNDCLYWSRVPLEDGALYRLYFADQASFEAFVERHIQNDRWKVCHYQNGLNGDQRFLGYQSGQIHSGFFASHNSLTLPEKSWMSGLLNEAFEGSPWPLLAGRSFNQVDQGPVICACFGVHRNPIQDAIENGCNSPEQLGKQLRCGTNCGSCIPELKQLIQEVS